LCWELRFYYAGLFELSIYLVDYVARLGVRGLIRFVRETLAGPWLDSERIGALFGRRHQLRFVRSLKNA